SKMWMPLAGRSRVVKVDATPATSATSASLAPIFVSESVHVAPFREQRASSTLARQPNAHLGRGKLTETISACHGSIQFPVSVEQMVADLKDVDATCGTLAGGESRCHTGYISHFSLIGTYFRLRCERPADFLALPSAGIDALVI
ncbi:MAG: hypothetical protein M3308_00990, partial [Actinomycetota bacterium]|nr:hypothetical protein [Actinomycetota bacterium]